MIARVKITIIGNFIGHKLQRYNFRKNI